MCLNQRQEKTKWFQNAEKGPWWLWNGIFIQGWLCVSKQMLEGLLNVLLKIAIILIKFLKIKQMQKIYYSMTISP